MIGKTTFQKMDLKPLAVFVVNQVKKHSAVVNVELQNITIEFKKL